MQRQGDDHALHVRVRKQLLIAIVVDLDCAAGRRFVRIAVFVDQTRAGGQGTGAGGVPMKCAVNVVGPDIGNCDDLDIVGVDRPHQHAPLIAGTDHTDADRVADAAAVTEVNRAEADTADHTCSHTTAEQVATTEGRAVFPVRGFWSLEFHHGIFQGM